jgi:hypothetical protein
VDECKPLPVDPKLLAAGDFVAALTAVCIARGAAGQDVASAGTVISILPFSAGWLGAGAFSGDYDADSPNEALQGNIPRAMSTGRGTHSPTSQLNLSRFGQ